jgi:hypothetical protein
VPELTEGLDRVCAIRNSVWIPRRKCPDLALLFVVSVTINDDHRHKGHHDMKYMLLLASNPTDEPAPGSDAFGPYMAEWAAYSQALAEAGALVAGEALQGVDTASTVQVRDGKRIVTDGPFIESKEVIGGYYVIDVADLDEALEWAARIPNAHFGTIEVRPVMEFDG